MGLSEYKATPRRLQKPLHDLFEKKTKWCLHGNLPALSSLKKRVSKKGARESAWPISLMSPGRLPAVGSSITLRSGTLAGAAAVAAFGGIAQPQSFPTNAGLLVPRPTSGPTNALPRTGTAITSDIWQPREF